MRQASIRAKMPAIIRSPLDSRVYLTREKATRELSALDRLAEPALRKALTSSRERGRPNLANYLIYSLCHTNSGEAAIAKKDKRTRVSNKSSRDPQAILRSMRLENRRCPKAEG